MRTLVLLAIITLATAASADDQPWAAGVTDQQKATAQALLDAGNKLFVEKRYPEALEQYKEAIASWDHPAIRFNIVRCLIQLDRPVEASENLQLALKYGAAPLEDNVHREALAYEKLLGSQIGELAITCKQAGARVTVDGQPFTTCPAPQTKRMAPGRHQIVATLDGYLTKTIEVVVVGGATEKVDVQLVTLAKAGKITHRWPKWIPWVVAGSGVVVGVFAGAVQLKAQADMGRYEAVVDRCSTRGCLDGELDTSLRDRAILENRIAIGMAIVGTATAITGGVLLYMNRGRLEVPVEVSPASRGDGAVVTYRLSF